MGVAVCIRALTLPMVIILVKAGSIENGTPEYTTNSAEAKASQELDKLYQKVIEEKIHPLNRTTVMCLPYIEDSYEEVLHRRYVNFMNMFMRNRACKITWIFHTFPKQRGLVLYVVSLHTECRGYVSFISGVSEDNTDVNICTSKRGVVVKVTSTPLTMHLLMDTDVIQIDTYLYFFLENRTDTATETTTESMALGTKQTDFTLEHTSSATGIGACQMKSCHDMYECTDGEVRENQCVCLDGRCEETDFTVIILSIAIPGVTIAVVVVICIWRQMRQGGICHHVTREEPRFWTGTIQNDYITKRKLQVPSLSPIMATILPKDVQLQLAPLLINPKTIQMQEELGRGAFGTVYKGRYNLDGSLMHVQTVAIKALTDKCIGTDINAFVTEALTMAEFSHCHVMPIIGVCISPQTEAPMIVLPFMEYGDLKAYLRKFRYEDRNIEPPDVKQLLLFCLHIARGMEYLSGLKFVHRDLAARNCMLDSNLVVKVADFGLTRDVYTGAYYRQDQQKLLPVKWMAIESLKDRVFSTFSDVWSFGVTMWEVLTLAMLPYPELDNADILTHLKIGKRLELPETCPDEFHPLMTGCWNEDPASRPSFREIASQIGSYLATTCDYLDLSADCKMDKYDSVNGDVGSCSLATEVFDMYERKEDSNDGIDLSTLSIHHMTS